MTDTALSTGLPDFSPENQKFVVFNACNEELSPGCPDPGLRIVGFFPTKEEAQAKIRRMQKRLDEEEQVDFWCFPVFEPFVVCKNRQRMQDPEYRHEKVNFIVDVRNQYLDARKQEFEEHKQYVHDPSKEESRRDTSKQVKNPFREKPRVKLDPKTGKPIVDASTGKPLERKKRRLVSSRQKALEAARQKKLESGQLLQCAQDYPREFEVRDQEYAAMSWLKDVNPQTLRGQDAQEPVFYIYRAFSTEQEALQWLQEVASKQIDDPPVEIVRMYGWLYPTKVDYNRVPELYANQELNDVMQAIHQDQKDTHNFEQWCLDNNVQVPAITMTQLEKGEVKKPEFHVEAFDAKDTQIPDDQAVYVDVKPLSEQTEERVKLVPKPKPKPKPAARVSSRRRVQAGKCSVPDKQL